MTLDAGQLNALAAILRLGSFEAAADELAVTSSAISQRIKALEDRIGIPLVHRGPPCTGTVAGLRLAKHAEDVRLLEAKLNRDLSLDQSFGPTLLKIAVPADSLATWFIAAMAGVDDMLFDLLIDDQDHSADWLRRGEVGAAITVGGKPVTGCDAYPLGTLRYIATASPGFVQHWFSGGVTPAALAKAPCMTFNRKDGLQKAWLAANAGARINPPSHFLPSTHAFVEAACAGIAWGMNPEPLVRDHLRAGRLLPLLPDTPLDVPLTWQVSRIVAPAITHLTGAIKTAAASGLQPD